MKNKSFGRTCFNVFNYTLLLVTSVICVLPFVHLLALSFSSSTAVTAGAVSLWPVDFTTKAYEFALQGGKFFKALWISAKRILLGVPINLFLIVITAYPLSKSKEKVAGRNLYMVFFAITMFVSGGMIPRYLVVSKLGLLDSIWSLVLPGALSVYNMVIMMNFMKGLPNEIEEAAFIDGAGPFQALFKIQLPLLKPCLATLGLFSVIGHWNSWFDGVIYMSDTSMYPLQSYLHGLLRNFEEMMQLSGGDYIEMLSLMNARTGRSAQLFLAALPIMLVYPFLQKYFVQGVMIGSLKG